MENLNLLKALLDLKGLIREISAGLVIAYAEDRNVEYLLLHYPAGHWDFVKGNVESGEDMLAAAIREAKEEAGIEGLEIVEGFRERIKYFYRRGGETVLKEVVFFLGISNTKEVKLSYEHTGYVWLPFKDALGRLTFDSSKEVLKKAHVKLLERLSQRALF